MRWGQLKYACMPHKCKKTSSWRTVWGHPDVFGPSHTLKQQALYLINGWIIFLFSFSVSLSKYQNSYRLLLSLCPLTMGGMTRCWFSHHLEDLLHYKALFWSLSHQSHTRSIYSFFLSLRSLCEPRCPRPWEGNSYYLEALNRHVTADLLGQIHSLLNLMLFLNQPVMQSFCWSLIFSLYVIPVMKPSWLSSNCGFNFFSRPTAIAG